MFWSKIKKFVFVASFFQGLTRLLEFLIFSERSKKMENNQSTVEVKQNSPFFPNQCIINPIIFFLPLDLYLCRVNIV